MRWVLFALLSTFLGIQVAVADQIGIPSHGPGIAARYFSGTACRISGSVILTDPDIYGMPRRIVRMELWLNGDMVKEWEPLQPLGGGAQQGPHSVGELGVVFDSTHFAHRSEVTVTFKAWANDSNFPLDAIAGFPVYNKAMTYGNGQINSGQSMLEQIRQTSCNSSVTYAKSVFDSLNFNTSMHYAPSTWDKDGFLASVHHSTAAHILTHGLSSGACASNASAYLTPPGVSHSFTDHDEHVHYIDVYVAKAEAFGSPFIPTLPPLNKGPNSTVGPGPFGIVLLDCCNVGADEDFCKAFMFPGTNIYVNPNPENQAVVGWDGLVSQKGAYARSQAFWDVLAQGMTAEEARLELAAQEAMESESQDVTPVIYGDRFARLTTVYTGGSVQAPNGWFY